MEKVLNDHARMRVVLIADVFPPLRSSGAVQLRDLSREFARQGHDVTVLVASPGLQEAWRIDMWEGVRIVRLHTPQTKDVSYLRRAIGEFLMPFAMLRNLKKSPLAKERWDGVIWYSPTIFLGPIASAIKKASGCPAYLIIRDIFPEWAVDMGLMGRGLPYRVFRAVARYQYSVADVIGVQTPGNLAYFEDLPNPDGERLQVLHNWLADAAVGECSIQLSETALRGRTLFVYAGNMGIAQGMGILLELADRLRDHTDIGFVFVGRGSDARRLRDDAKRRGLDNVCFFDEIDPDEVPALYRQCHAGLVALDPRHKTHNIPGKFLSYMQSSLPVLAAINAGNDLVGLIGERRVGRVCVDDSADTLATMALELIAQLGEDSGIRGRCRAIAKNMFSADAAVHQIVMALQAQNERHSTLIATPGRPDRKSAAIPAGQTASEYPSKL